MFLIDLYLEAPSRYFINASCLNTTHASVVNHLCSMSFQLRQTLPAAQFTFSLPMNRTWILYQGNNVPDVLIHHPLWSSSVKKGKLPGMLLSGTRM